MYSGLTLLLIKIYTYKCLPGVSPATCSWNVDRFYIPDATKGRKSNTPIFGILYSHFFSFFHFLQMIVYRFLYALKRYRKNCQIHIVSVWYRGLFIRKFSVFFYDGIMQTVYSLL